MRTARLVALFGLGLIVVNACDSTARVEPGDVLPDFGADVSGGADAAPDVAAEDAPPAAADSDPGGDSVQPPVFRHTVYTYTDAAGRSGLATGTFATPAVAYAPVPVDPRYRHVLTFRMTPFLPPLRRAEPTHGPIILFSDDLDVIVFSPLDHFFVSVVDYVDGQLTAGLAGEVDAAPEGFAHRFLLVEGRGINATVARWGELLRADRGTTGPDRYADEGLSFLGYWTDNGAFYYYHTPEGQTYAETLLGVKADADANGIPLGYLQIDSWWYFKEGSGGLLPWAGLLRWEPLPAAFPDGLAAFQQALGLPLVAHNRWFDADNEYVDEFEFVFEGDMALPTGPGVFERFMADAVSWGIVTYEQDWLVTQYHGLSYLRNHVDHAADWMAHLDGAAAGQGLTVQLCMAGAAHLMDAVDRASPTTIRTSTDYRPDISKETFWPAFHTVNLLAAAVGLWPFKDNFRSSEAHGEAEALVSALSAGMVGVGDGIGLLRRDILLRTCRADGLLLKPDRPVTPLDAMFLPHARPYLTSTESRRADVGTTVYLAAYHLASAHPQRTAMDRAWAAVSYDGADIGDLFVYPPQVTDWEVDLAADLGWRGPAVVYDWRRGTAEAVSDGRFTLPDAPGNYDFAYVVVAPVQSNGLALIGEPAKYVTLADRRFRAVTALPDGFAVELEGAPGEEVTLLAFDTTSGRLLPPATATIGPDGAAASTLRR